MEYRGMRNYKAAERYVHSVTDPAEHQWLELILFQIVLHQSRQTAPSDYDCDCLFVVQAMQDLWHRPGVLVPTVQGIIRPDEDWGAYP